MKTLTYTSSDSLACACGGDVIICVSQTLTEGGAPYVSGTLVSADRQFDSCGKYKFVYTILYSELQLLNQNYSLVQTDVQGIICKGCLTNYIDYKVQARELLCSVKDFGAVGDGTTDDTTAIQTALLACKAVYFPAGSYKITRNLTSTDVSIYGVPGQSIIKASGAAVTTALMVSSTIDALTGMQKRSTIEGITLDGSGATGCTGLVCGNGTSAIAGNFLAKELTVAHFDTVGIRLDTVLEAAFENLTCNHNGIGCQLKSETVPLGFQGIVAFRSCNFETSTLQGVQISGPSSAISFDSCVFENNGAAGFQSDCSLGSGNQSLTGLYLRNCWFENNFYAQPGHANEFHIEFLNPALTYNARNIVLEGISFSNDMKAIKIVEAFGITLTQLDVWNVVGGISIYGTAVFKEITFHDLNPFWNWATIVVIEPGNLAVVDKVSKVAW